MNHQTLKQRIKQFLMDKTKLNKGEWIADIYSQELVDIYRVWEKEEKTRIQREVEEMNQKYREGDSTW